MGGDNFMVVTNSEFKNFAKDFIKISKDEFEIELKLWNRHSTNI